MFDGFTGARGSFAPVKQVDQLTPKGQTHPTQASGPSYFYVYVKVKRQQGSLLAIQLVMQFCLHAFV